MSRASNAGAIAVAAPPDCNVVCSSENVIRPNFPFCIETGIGPARAALSIILHSGGQSASLPQLLLRRRVKKVVPPVYKCQKDGTRLCVSGQVPLVTLC